MTLLIDVHVEWSRDHYRFRFRLVCNALRLAIWLVLQGRPGCFFVLLAVVCSSWVPTNCGTSRRSIAFAEGRDSLSYVAAANCMASRCLHYRGLTFEPLQYMHWG